MPIPSCLSRLGRLRPRPTKLLRAISAQEPRSPGQVLVLFAVALVGLLFFIGMAIDAGSLYVTYGQLKRAVDASAVSAANDFKRGAPLSRMNDDASETLNLHNVPMSQVDLHVYVCDADQDGVRDASLATTQPTFYARCPDTTSPANQSPRKLVWVDAKQRAPLYFLRLMGVEYVTLRTNAIAEAAPVDVVIVFDTSNSMGKDTPNYVANQYNPDDAANGCNPVATVGSPRNPAGNCQPLGNAKAAAKALIDTLYDGYDRVSIVTFDQLAYVHPIRNKANTADISLSDNLTDAKAKVDAIKLHYDAPYNYIWPDWAAHPGSFNPVNMEDRDGDGVDLDSLGFACPPFETSPGVADPRLVKRWWSVADGAPNPYGWGGVPCDDGTKNDSINWSGLGTGNYTAADTTASDTWQITTNPDPVHLTNFLSPLSTCSGCGIRVAGNVLKTSGRPGAVWVMIFLSDGITNLSDRPGTGGTVPNAYPDGFCTGGLNSTNWRTYCVPQSHAVRHCIDQNSYTCPPGSSWSAVTPNPNYNVLDYALDMVDDVALTKSTNLQEPAGNDIAIYSIGLGSDIGSDAYLLHYMADVGDDGDRTTAPCSAINNATTNCGQYYYAPTGSALLPIFEDIATRIYTRITD